MISSPEPAIYFVTPLKIDECVIALKRHSHSGVPRSRGLYVDSITPNEYVVEYHTQSGYRTPSRITLEGRLTTDTSGETTVSLWIMPQLGNMIIGVIVIALSCFMFTRAVAVNDGRTFLIVVFLFFLAGCWVFYDSFANTHAHAVGRDIERLLRR